ncbi:unnamed protein product [Thelazia callipaeda]|uniref:MYND-type domain-containing protein n=1 Tax=Thelazia callipaeda TaxID=103827 RepID=A0A0N5CXL2_THECL|nr:unnamed protein product [Thelazia callipaeda]
MDSSNEAASIVRCDPDNTVERLFIFIHSENANEVLQILNNKEVSLDVVDKTGMSLLDQASWSGLADVVQFLLANGVNPNRCDHDSGYKSLMFAAIAGHQEICQLLLDYGAHAFSTNSVGKTAAEMAAFVGQHECVSIINSYVEMDEIEKLLHPKGNDSDEVYPKEFSQALHDLIKTHLIHPVWVMFFIRDHYDIIWPYHLKFCYVLDRVFERQLRCKQSNEVMSLKLWLVLYTVRDVFKFLEGMQDIKKYNAKALIKSYAKQLLKMERSDQIRPNFERYLRSAVQAFPYHHCLLFQTLVKNLAAVKFGNLPDAFHIIMVVFSGQRMVETSHFCATCGAITYTKRCCNNVYYCHSECQRLDWSNHKMFCNKFNNGKQNGNCMESKENIDMKSLEQNTSRNNEIIAALANVDLASSCIAALMFVEIVDPISGKRTWKVADEDYDLAQEIARSAYGDMVHDFERNQKYELALRSVISELKRKEKRVHVVDIGAGTGLLSMMAMRSGADCVTAIEMMKPIATCAEKIIMKNGYEGKIRLVASRSTELMNEELNTFEKGHIIVSEVFDTELIGEGALRTFKEAHEKLAKPGCRVVPSSARTYIVPVQSDFLSRFHKFSFRGFKIPEPNKCCPGTGAVHDIQLSEVPMDKITLLTSPFITFSFNFEDGPSIKYRETVIKTFTAQTDGTLEAILMWWELDMDGKGTIILSTAPKWWNSEAKWRDHWMQGVYYPSKRIKVRKNQLISLSCSHDEFSFRFDIYQDEYVSIFQPKPQVSLAKYCTCRIHCACSRNTMYRLNERDDDIHFKEFLKKNFTGKTVACFDGGSLVSLMLAKYAKMVQVVELDPSFTQLVSSFIDENDIKNVYLSDDTSASLNQVDAILSEPFDTFSILPWHSLHFWFVIHRHLLSSKVGDVLLSPKEGLMCAIPVKFENLWKIAASVGIIQNFDLTPFGDLTHKARSAVDAMVEPQPLWEYPSIVTGKAVAVARLDFSKRPVPATFKVDITSSIVGTNAIVLWMDWLHDGYQLRTGLLNTPEIGERPRWCIPHQQGVYFFPELERKRLSCASVTLEANFCDDGQFVFHFNHNEMEKVC